MTLRHALVATLFCLLLDSHSASAACALDRAPVKTLTDAQASQVRMSPVPVSIEALHSMPMARPLPHDGRIAPVETTTYSVTATLIGYRMTAESEIHLVLSDDARRTIIAKIPSPACAAGSPVLDQISTARAVFEQRYAAVDVFLEVRQPIEVQGAGFFDFLRGERGQAPNGISLHPVTAIDFTPTFVPKAPSQPNRRRSVGGRGEKRCKPPALTIATSRASACAGEQVVLSWQASDANASVTIDGIGAALPPSGSRTVTLNGSSVYSGRASTACGTGDEAVAVVTLSQSANASLTGPSTLTAGSSGSLFVSMSGASSWTLTSSLRNSISPSAGTASSSATYTATNSGTDTVTLLTSGGACGNVARTLTIFITPPMSSGLLCCDGTRSSTCYDCNNKRGCCSSHGGVCGCPK